MRKVQIAMAGTRGNNSQAERSQSLKTSSSRSFQNSNHHDEHQPKAPTKRNHLQEPFMGTQKHNLIICPEGKMIKTNANCILSICYYLYSTQKGKVGLCCLIYATKTGSCICSYPFSHFLTQDTYKAFLLFRFASGVRN